MSWLRVLHVTLLSTSAMALWRLFSLCICILSDVALAIIVDYFSRWDYTVVTVKPVTNEQTLKGNPLLNVR